MNTETWLFYVVCNGLYIVWKGIFIYLEDIQRRYFYTFKEARNRFHSPAGRYDKPIPTRFLAPPIDCSKISAQEKYSNSCKGADKFVTLQAHVSILGTWEVVKLLGGIISATGAGKYFGLHWAIFSWEVQLQGAENLRCIQPLVAWSGEILLQRRNG